MDLKVENSFWFGMEEVEFMAKFVAEIVRQGLTYKVDGDAGGFRIYLTGGF